MTCSGSAHPGNQSIGLTGQVAVRRAGPDGRRRTIRAVRAAGGRPAPGAAESLSMQTNRNDDEELPARSASHRRPYARSSG